MPNAGFCVHCGKPYEAGVSFCSGCGQKLSGNTTAGAEASFPSQAGQMPQGGMPSYPPPPNPGQPFASPSYPPPPSPGQPFASQPYPPPPYPAKPVMQPPPKPVSAGNKSGLPTWGIALLILVPVAIALVLFWQPLLALFNGRTGGGAAQASDAPNGQPTFAAGLPTPSSTAAEDRPDTSAAAAQTGDAAESGKDGETGEYPKQDVSDVEPPLFPPAELAGYYDFHVEYTETTENGSPVVDPDLPVGYMKIMPVYLSMDNGNEAVIHHNRKDEAEGEPSFLTAVVNGDKMNLFDMSRGEGVMRVYQGTMRDDRGSILIEGTFEQMAGRDPNTGRVIRGNWQLVSMSDTIFEGVDTTRADKDLDWREPEGTFEGTLTYTGFVNLDTTTVFDESTTQHLKSLHNVPMNTTLIFSGDHLELMIQDSEGGEMVLEDFWPIDVREGRMFTQTMDDVKNPRYLGAVMHQVEDKLRLEARYTHLIRSDDEFVVLLMRIEAEKPLP